MSSNMNIRLLTSSASSGSRASRPSTICRSVARSERLMMWTSGSTPPTREMSVGCSTEESLRSRVASTACSDVGRGPVHDRDAVGHLGLQLGVEAGQHQGGLVAGQVGEHQRDDLRVLVRR